MQYPRNRAAVVLLAADSHLAMAARRYYKPGSWLGNDHKLALRFTGSNSSPQEALDVAYFIEKQAQVFAGFAWCLCLPAGSLQRDTNAFPSPQAAANNF